MSKKYIKQKQLASKIYAAEKRLSKLENLVDKSNKFSLEMLQDVINKEHIKILNMKKRFHESFHQKYKENYK